MNGIRIGLQSLMLVLADFAGIIGGFLAFKAFDFDQIDQMLVHLPVAVAITIVGFGLWSASLRIIGRPRLWLQDLKELLLVFIVSLALAPAIFVPAHFFTQGYLTAGTNLLVLALYQMPVNLVALCGVWVIQN